MRTPPKLSASQRQDALDKAARTRKARAEIKNRVKSGELSFTEVLDLAKSDSVAGKMRVRELIEAVPGVGKIPGTGSGSATADYAYGNLGRCAGATVGTNN